MRASPLSPLSRLSKSPKPSSGRLPFRSSSSLSELLMCYVMRRIFRFDYFSSLLIPSPYSLPSHYASPPVRAGSATSHKATVGVSSKNADAGAEENEDAATGAVDTVCYNSICTTSAVLVENRSESTNARRVVR